MKRIYELGTPLRGEVGDLSPTPSLMGEASVEVTYRIDLYSPKLGGHRSLPYGRES